MEFTILNCAEVWQVPTLLMNENEASRYMLLRKVDESPGLHIASIFFDALQIMRAPRCTAEYVVYSSALFSNIFNIRNWKGTGLLKTITTVAMWRNFIPNFMPQSCNFPAILLYSLEQMNDRGAFSAVLLYFFSSFLLLPAYMQSWSRWPLLIQDNYLIKCILESKFYLHFDKEFSVTESLNVIIAEFD